MSKISLDLSSIKSAGVYTIEIDESQRGISYNVISSLRLLVGFSGKGPFNRPVFLQTEAQRQKLFGDIDPKLESKGCFFNRNAQTMLNNGPILALNLLKVDDTYDGPDQVNYTALSLDAGAKNPIVRNPGITYGEYDHLAETVDAELYGTEAGDAIPFVGKTPFSSLFDRSRFWLPSELHLQHVAAAGLGVNSTAGYEKSNFLSFANCGTDEISILVYKPEGFKAYEITAKDWYGGVDNIPYGWIRPSDYMSDYFIRVVAVKGNWTNYPVLSADNTWGKYFDKKGILKSKIFDFGQAEGISFIGSWTGSIIPDFTDKQGNYLYIKDRVNSQAAQTGLIMSINEDAMSVISYDLNGMDVETGNELGTGAWIYDFDGNAEGESEAGESEVGQNGFLIDMVGHGFQNGLRKAVETKQLTISFPASMFDGGTGTLGADTSVWYLDSVNPDITGSNEAKVQTPAYVETETRYPKGSSASKAIAIDAVGASLHLYGVYDGSTNRRLQDDYCYVSLSEDAYFNLKQAADDPSTSATVNTIIKGLTAYDEFGNASVGTIAAVDPEVISVNLRDDLDDNTKYNDVSAYYGGYAAYNQEKNTVFLFDIAAKGDGAAVYDGDIIDMSEHKITNWTIKDGGVDKDLPVYEFTHDATAYGIGTGDNAGKMYAEYETGNPAIYGFAFMSYDYTNDTSEEVLTNIRKAYYFNGKTNTARYGAKVALEDTNLFYGNNPAAEDCLNLFIVTDEKEAGRITMGDFVENITFHNNIGDATKYGLIPGITRVTSKVFVTLTASNEFTYNKKTYTFNSEIAEPIHTRSGKRGFYLFTTVDPVLISNRNIITRQLPIENDIISHSLRFIPLKGLHISSRHKPGYDANGRLGVEAGIEKIYSVLEDEGIRKGLMSENLDFRYIVDSFSFGLGEGKYYLSALAAERGSTTALINMPSKSQFEMSNDPVFCDTYDAYASSRKSFKIKYLETGGNPDMYNTHLWRLPNESEGSKNAAAFFPHLLYRERNGKEILVPPAADVSNTFMRKFQGGNPYAVVANMDGIIQNPKLLGSASINTYGVECELDNEDRNTLETIGANAIIFESGQVKIYGNKTCYQEQKSDFNLLSTRENLNTLEIACSIILKQFAFKYNTPQTRALCVSKLTPVFEAMKTSQALWAYNITCDESNNTDDLLDEQFMIVDIEVAMSPTCEKIVQRFHVKRRIDMDATV
jgi:hypothetical protein